MGTQFLKNKFRDVKQDLYGAFVIRGIDLVRSSGLLAIVIGDTWMSIKSFEALRLQLINGHTFGSFIHMRDVSNHPDIFGANAAFVLSMTGSPSSHSPFVRLSSLGSDRKEEELRKAIKKRTNESGYHLASSKDFSMVPGSPIVYWLSENVLRAFAEHDPLGSVTALAVGLQTGDNNRFLRQWWEVSSARRAFGCASRAEAAASGARWFPYNKGGEFRKWYGNQEFVVNWENDGEEIRNFGTEEGGRPRSRAQNTETYFSPSVSWSDISSGEASFRRFPSGFIHDVKGMSAFGEDELLDRVALLGNSRISLEVLRAVAPTINFQIGDVGKIPVAAELRKIPANISDLVALSKRDWEESETSWNFLHSPLILRFECD